MPQPNKHSHIELSLPAVLPLGIIKLANAGPNTGGGREALRIAHLGVALQHPPVQIFAQAAPQTTVSGPRADIAATYLERFVATSAMANSAMITSVAATKAEIEIELAIPAYMGLGSEPVLGVGMAKALSWFSQRSNEGEGIVDEDAAALAGNLALEPHYNLELCGTTGGGLLLVDPTLTAAETSPLLWRAEVQHADKDAWAFVLVMLRTPVDTAPSLEADRRITLLKIAKTMTTESGELFERVIQPAVEQDDIATFGQGLMALQQLNHRALADAGHLPSLTEQEQAVLNLMQEQGAVAWGQSPDGLCLYALTKGARSTIDMRTTLREIVGHTDGHTIATITDNRGARVLEKPGALPIHHEMHPA